MVYWTKKDRQRYREEGRNNLERERRRYRGSEEERERKERKVKMCCVQ
jgi:hypothetical protein